MTDARSSPGAAGPGLATALRLRDILSEPANLAPSPLSGSQDLLDLFHLLPVYDTYVRPYVTLPTATPTSPKGKEREPSGGTTSVGFSIGGVRIGGVAVTGGTATEDKAKKVKMDKTYTHLVADIPGRNTIKKDKHIRDCVLNPDLQSVHPTPFEPSALRDAFSLKPGQIPGFDAMIWETEVDVPKKKKKKRKHEAGTEGAPGSMTVGGGGEDEHRKKKKRKDGSP